MSSSLATFTPFFYLMSDETKTAVDPKTIAPGAQLVYVSSYGTETPVVLGAVVKKDPAARKAAHAENVKKGPEYEG